MIVIAIQHMQARGVCGQGTVRCLLMQAFGSTANPPAPLLPHFTPLHFPLPIPPITITIMETFFCIQGWSFLCIVDEQWTFFGLADGQWTNSGRIVDEQWTNNVQWTNNGRIMDEQWTNSGRIMDEQWTHVPTCPTAVGHVFWPYDMVYGFRL